MMVGGTDLHDDTGAPDRRERRLGLAARILGGVLLAALVLVALPLAPTLPVRELDSSWSFGMNEAVARGLVFGRDIIFTFGPYAALYTAQFHPATDSMMMASAALVALSFGLGLVALGGRWSWLWLLVTLVVIALLDRADAYFLALPLILLALVCRSDTVTGAPSPPLAALAIPLLIPATALLCLVKGSFALAALLLGGLAFAAALPRRPRRALAGVAAFIVALALFWVLAGQPITALPGYFVSQVEIVRGYGLAMSWPGPFWHVALYVVIAGLLTAAVFVFPPRVANWADAMLALGAIGAFFIAFKAGFVRHDAHALAAAGFLPLAAAVLASRAPWPIALPGVAAGMAGFLAIASSYVAVSPLAIAGRLGAQASAVATGLGTRLGGGYAGAFGDTLARIRARAPLETREGTADVLTIDIATLLANGIDWSPRPVLQSYQANTARLAAWNAQHFEGPAAPDRVYVDLATIDGRLPTLDDAQVWPQLLDRYRFGGFEGDFAVFERRAGTAAAPRTPLSEGTFALGEAIPVPPTDGAVWAEIDSRPSFAGRILDLLYKIEPLTIELRSGALPPRGFRYVSEAGRGGFLVSPLLSSRFDFAKLAARGSAAMRPVDTVRLVAPAWTWWAWEPSVTVRLTAITIAPTAGATADFEAPAVEVPADPPVGGTCFVESVDGVPVADDAPAIADGTFEIVGWARLPDDAAATPDAIYVLVTGRDGTRSMFAARSQPRPDVGVYFGLAGGQDFGFTADIDTGSLGRPAALQIVSRKGDALTLCPRRLAVKD